MTANATRIRPPLKWAGSKFRIIENILQLLPEGKRLIEPFVGSGALFLNTNYPRYLINDINKDLISFYKTLKKGGDEFIAECGTLFTESNNHEKAYYRFRTEFNETSDRYRKAAIFLYLNKHGYNGLCRYNSSGEHNVPFGRYRQPYFPLKELQHFVKRSSQVRIESRDFQSIINGAKEGDVIYCDPPYVPLSATSNFTTYSAGGFSEEDQIRLATLAKASASRGVPVLISNHCTKFTDSLYQNANAKKIVKLSVRRLISCNGNNRQNADELLALFA